MRWLVWTVAGAAVLWSGLWIVAARITDGAVADWLAARRGAVTAQVSVAGFPNRLDLTATGVAAGDTVQGPGWQAPFAQVFAMIWKPWHLIAALPNEQTVVLPGGLPLSLGSDRFQASLVLVPDRSLALDRLNVAADALRVTGPGLADPLRIDALRLAAHRDPAAPATLRLGIEATGLLPPATVRAAFPAARPPPDGTLRLRLDVRVELTAPVDLNAMSTLPVPLAADIAGLTLEWGDMAIEARGRLSVDDRGYLQGEVRLDLAGWQTALDLAVATGTMRPGVAGTWAAFAGQLQDPVTGRITLPLVYASGTARFGPLPLGMAPRIAR